MNIGTPKLWRSSVLAVLVAVLPWLPSRAQACACCMNNAVYSVSQGVDAYKIGEIRKLSGAWAVALDAGEGESGISMTEPQASVQLEPGNPALAWRIVLTEKDSVTGRVQKVVLRFTPEPAKKWLYIAHTAPLQTQSELTGMAHDFVMQGTITVLNDPAKIMKNIRTMAAQMVLYAKGNQCLSSQDFFAVMLDVSLTGKDNQRGQLLGQGRITP
jgi:hypothetical protein